MKRWSSIISLVGSLSATDAIAQSATDTARSITLSAEMGETVVPPGRMWRVDAAPVLTNSGVSTADLYIDGEVYVGADSNLTLLGHFEVAINAKRVLPFWIRGGARVKVGDSRERLVVTEIWLEPWHKPVPPLESLASLARHVGEYPCRTGLLGAPVLQRAIKSVLADDYGRYLEHIEQSGCGAIERQRNWLLLDVSQLHVGGYSSFILIKPETSQVWVFWLLGPVSDQKWKLYGSPSIPSDVSNIVVDALNQSWGHVASFSWRDGKLIFGPPKSAVLPNRMLQPPAPHDGQR